MGDNRHKHYENKRCGRDKRPVSALSMSPGIPGNGAAWQGRRLLHSGSRKSMLEPFVSFLFPLEPSNSSLNYQLNSLRDVPLLLVRSAPTSRRSGNCSCCSGKLSIPLPQNQIKVRRHRKREGQLALCDGQAWSEWVYLVALSLPVVLLICFGELLGT